MRAEVLGTGLVPSRGPGVPGTADRGRHRPSIGRSRAASSWESTWSRAHAVHGILHHILHTAQPVTEKEAERVEENWGLFASLPILPVPSGSVCALLTRGCLWSKGCHACSHPHSAPASLPWVLHHSGLGPCSPTVSPSQATFAARCHAEGF